nr:hypothetical protein [Lachnospiraceae bacterium]
MKKKIVSILLAACMTVSLAVPALADEETEIQNQKAASEAELSSKEAELESLRIQQQEIQSQISSLDSDIVDLMIQIDQAARDIALTEENIAKKAGEIAATEKELAASEAQRDRQYRDMKKRIQYIYENGGSVGWATVILNATDFSSFMNKAEYASELHEADRAAFQAYVDTVKQIEAFKQELELQEAALEEQKKGLESMKTSLELQNKELNRQLEEKKKADANYASRIEEARSQAEAISDLINRQNARLAEIEAEKQAAAAAAAEAAAA